ncbi:MAG: MotA/TolQ/ExbB proton channel family protein [Gammaproteobacteria bacterium]
MDLISLIVQSDRSKISIIILSIYVLASMHWFYIAITLDKEIASVSEPTEATLIGRYLLQVNTSSERINLTLVEDELSNKHSLGYLAIDVLLKLGLTGTVIGFILMLLPIGEIQDFDPKVLQQLLSTMSGGMAVALYTTLTGLVTSMLLKFQYFILDSSLSHTLNHISSEYQ